MIKNIKTIAIDIKLVTYSETKQEQNNQKIFEIFLALLIPFSTSTY